MPPPAMNLAGQRFGKLVVKSRDGNVTPAKWICKCDCGNVRSVLAANLRRGATVSCGCKKNTIHGHGRTRTVGISSTYRSWSNMISRCTYEYNNRWEYYGGRGIDVCKRWRKDFRNFLADMGERPAGTTLDRIDVNKNYTPSNCRWATPKQQAANRRARGTAT